MSKKLAEDGGINKRWMGRLIGIIVIIIFVALFVVQNSELVPIRFFPLLRYEVSLALLILVSFCLGALTAILLSLPSYWHAMKGRNASRNRISKLEEEIGHLKSKLSAYQAKGAPKKEA